jgi:hypothetical protein
MLPCVRRSPHAPSSSGTCMHSDDRRQRRPGLFFPSPFFSSSYKPASLWTNRFLFFFNGGNLSVPYPVHCPFNRLTTSRANVRGPGGSYFPPLARDLGLLIHSSWWIEWRGGALSPSIFSWSLFFLLSSSSPFVSLHSWAFYGAFSLSLPLQSFFF